MVGPTPAEWLAIGLIHLGVLLRMVRVRRLAAAQRTIELERFRAIREALKDA